MSNEKGTVAILEVAAGELTYLPTPEQRKAKSAFYARWNDSPLCDPSDITVIMAVRLSGDSRINRWWTEAGFKEWFRNQDEFRQRMEYLSNLAMDSLEYILVDPKSQGSAKVNAAKLIMEIAKKMPPKHAVQQYLDEKISQMDRKQLEEYIQRSIRTIAPSDPVDMSDTDN